MQVLILENDPAEAEQIARLTSDCGHDVEGCASTEGEALRLASNTHLDLVIADVDLGQEPDGIEIAKTLRETAGLKTIFISSHGEAATRDRAQAVWPLAFLGKPIIFDTFWRVLKSAADQIGLSRLARARAQLGDRIVPQRGLMKNGAEARGSRPLSRGSVRPH